MVVRWPAPVMHGGVTDAVFANEALVSLFGGALIGSNGLSSDKRGTGGRSLARPGWNFPAKALLAALLGGAILMFGARLAGGYTSGHGMSGTLQLALFGMGFLRFG
jgi:uncharacterized membrane protein YedE/YeeE